MATFFSISNSFSTMHETKKFLIFERFYNLILFTWAHGLAVYRLLGMQEVASSILAGSTPFSLLIHLLLTKI